MHIKTMLLAATALSVAARAFAGEDNTQVIKDALNQLDVNNDDHWTAAGEPRIDTVKALTGDTSVNRAAIEKAMPGFNREAAGGENRPGTQQGGEQGNQSPAQNSDQLIDNAVDQSGHNPMTAAAADGWVKHPDTAGFHYRGSEVKADAEVAAMYPAQEGGQVPSDANLKADGSTGPVTDPAADISGQTGMGGAMTARSPEPVEGELRKTHVSELSQGEPGERPIGITQGVTDLGHNALGTPPGTVENAGRALELSGEVQARNAGSVLTPSQAPAHSSSPAAPSNISLGGAADPLVEARAPGGAVIAEGADPATFFEGETVGGPFGHSGTTAGDGSSQAKLGAMDVTFEGDTDAVEALEAELEETANRTNELRQQVDDLSAQLHTSLRTEAQLRRQIEANRPRTGNMATIQHFLRTSHERRAAQVIAEREAGPAKREKRQPTTREPMNTGGSGA